MTTDDESLSPFEMISEAGEQICAILKRGNLAYDDAPELFRALWLVDRTLKSYQGYAAMAEKAETEAVVH